MPTIRSAILMSVFFYAVYGAASYTVYLASYGGPGFDRSLVFLFQQTTAWTATLLVAARNAGAAWRECFPLTRIAPRLVLPLVLASIGAFIVLGEISSLIPMPESVREYLENFRGNGLLAGISAVIVAPVAEEMFHRGWMLRGFLGHYSRRKSVLVTATIFAVFHLNPWQAVMAFPLGVAYAWLVLMTGSLVPSILSHAVVNSAERASELILAKLGYDTDTMKHAPLPVLVFGIVLLVLAGYRVYREVTRTASNGQPDGA